MHTSYWFIKEQPGSQVTWATGLNTEPLNYTDEKQVRELSGAGKAGAENRDPGQGKFTKIKDRKHSGLWQSSAAAMVASSKQHLTVMIDFPMMPTTG